MFLLAVEATAERRALCASKAEYAWNVREANAAVLRLASVASAPI
jgi:hypothetical protein